MHASTKSSPICNLNFIRNKGWKWNVCCNYSVFISSFPTFFKPANPSDSRKKNAKGINTNKHRFEKREARFHKPATNKKLTLWVSHLNILHFPPLHITMQYTHKCQGVMDIVIYRSLWKTSICQHNGLQTKPGYNLPFNSKCLKP